jgi:hypothetical protein
VGLVHEHHAHPADVAVRCEGGRRDELSAEAAREAGVGPEREQAPPVGFDLVPTRLGAEAQCAGQVYFL